MLGWLLCRLATFGNIRDGLHYAAELFELDRAEGRQLDVAIVEEIVLRAFERGYANFDAFGELLKLLVHEVGSFVVMIHYTTKWVLAVCLVWRI